MTAMLDFAHSYIEGAPQWPLIPIAPATKRPPIKTGRDHAEHMTTDLRVVESWLRRGWEIGMPTGAASGAVVIDVDKKHDGEALLAELEHPDVLGPLPRTKVSLTRNLGQHIFCAHPGNGIRVRSAGPRGELAKLLCNRPGIDVRGDGGLVVLPPSCGYTWLVDEQLQPLPKLWLLAINGAGKPPAKSLAISHADAISDDRKVSRARAYLAKMSPSVSGNGGHDALWAAVLAMRIGFDLDESTVKTLIASDFNPRCDPPWDERDLDHKLDGVERSDKASERGYLLRSAP